MTSICTQLKTAGQAFAGKNFPPTDPQAKILLLTHTDMDGEGSDIILEHTIYRHLETRRIGNHDMDAEIKALVTENIIDNYDFVFVTDISCNEDTCQLIAEHSGANKLMIIDHHPNADYLNNYPFGLCHSSCLLDSATTKWYDDMLMADHKLGKCMLRSSGTSLFFDYLTYAEYPFENQPTKTIRILSLLSHVIRCYDTWDWSDFLGKWDVCEKLDILFDIYGPIQFKNKISNNILYYKYVAPLHAYDAQKIFLDETDHFMLLCEETKIAEFLKTVPNLFKTGSLTVPDEQGIERTYSVLYIPTGHYMQQVSEYAKINYPDIDIYLFNSGRISFRAQKPSVNLTQIARYFGGGGHPQAAGMDGLAYETIEKLICSDVFDGRLSLNTN